ncbi:30S ribosomal protein S2 [Candidatus Wolfebacteria bacterium RIFCSPLOWO2_01_FULL_38_11]|uniref:Small ribosomal subunit protein uS2 n=2 Tax=Candidatus Wolfeibacteriota TaxID=1752735 RepID=A0A0G0FRF2_9BACT|nr:MAG: 30S ribosomal protein S2 [Candidatus Wolfebacteria bacterium GW2011_GWC1_37_10]OGM92140.1 MAG: 30S ribosomal protein S2 [Candidatus Wolfebacteria bacterium RIFCSPLOWO2_01_FULL_38_11]
MKDTSKSKTQLTVVEEEVKEKEIEAIASAADIESIKEMMKAGLMYGHKTNRTEPKFKSYISLSRNNIEIIDLSQTLLAINEAAEFLKKIISENKMVLLVATQSAAQEAIEKFAKKFNFPYVKNRWLGGLITNFKVLSTRIEKFKKNQIDMEKGEFDKYTKKERVVINKNIARMRILFGGLENLTKLPDALLIIDSSLKNHKTAIREARQLNIPVIGIIDSDDNPEFVDMVIPANDHAKMSIDFIIDKIMEKIS